MNPTVIPPIAKSEEPKIKVDRILGVYTKSVPGPTLICIAGMHGNEPAGILAFQRVFNRLNKTGAFISGRLVGLSGNIKALELGQRFIQKDLNREWSTKNILAIKNDHDKRTYVEAQQQRSLYHEIRHFLAERSGPAFFIDLHTTSSESQPYISINDTLRNREMAQQYPLPIVLGLEEHLEGTALSYINELGHIALGFEGGQHDDPAAISNLESVIWLTLLFSGQLSREQLPDLDRHYRLLAKNMLEKRKVFEIRHRHGIDSKDNFSMNEGYINFQHIHKGEVIATDKTGDIKAPETGRIFMPLYQAQGNDGYFIIRQIKWFWLKVSAFLRKTRFHRVLHLLPGVHKYEGLNYTLVVNTRIAMWYVREFFHLMGFRRKRIEGKYTIFLKREFDVREP